MSVDSVICEVCYKSFGQITYRHLKMHGLTYGEYKAIYPNAKLISAVVLKMMANYGENNPNYGKDFSGANNPNYGNHPVAWNKGLTKETDKRVAQNAVATSIARLGKYIGQNNPFFGKHHTQEIRAKMSEVRKGRNLSGEWKRKIGEASKQRWLNPEYICRMKKRIGWNKGLTKETDLKVASYAKKQAEYAKTPEHCQHISEAKKGQYLSEETKHKIGEASRQQWSNPEYVYKMSETRKQLWQNPEYRDKVTKNSRLGLKVHPNKPEMELLVLLQSILPEWKFVGDGQLIVDGKNPDFWNGDHKLIELFGDYWHKGENPQKRIAIFKHFGFDTLIIWGSELSSKNAIREKVLAFVGGDKD